MSSFHLIPPSLIALFRKSWKSYDVLAVIRFCDKENQTWNSDIYATLPLWLST
jgi:hypothetical protein